MRTNSQWFRVGAETAGVYHAMAILVRPLASWVETRKPLLLYDVNKGSHCCRDHPRKTWRRLLTAPWAEFVVSRLSFLLRRYAWRQMWRFALHLYSLIDVLEQCERLVRPLYVLWPLFGRSAPQLTSQPCITWSSECSPVRPRRTVLLQLPEFSFSAKYFRH